MTRGRSRDEPRCARCGNEEDLRTCATGDEICQHCLRCPHDADDTCPVCLRFLHTEWTFEGPRIRDAVAYMQEAWTVYGTEPAALLHWTFEEQEAALTAEPPTGPPKSIPRLPPHLRR